MSVLLQVLRTVFCYGFVLTLSTSFSVSLYFLLRSNLSFGIDCCNFNRWLSAVRSFVSAALHSV